MSNNLNLRLGLFDFRPIFFVNPTTKKPDGIMSSYFYRWGLVLYQGFNVTYENGGKGFGSCINGTCTQLARFIQSNGSDCNQLFTGMHLYDSIYPNLTLSPAVDEKGCLFLTYYRNPLTEFSLDCLITLKTIQPTVIILIIGLAIFVKLTPLIAVLTSHHQRQYNETNKVIIKDTKITITKVAKMIIGTNGNNHLTSSTTAIQLMRITLTVAVTLLQIWYSANFQTDLSLTSSESPVTSLSDLIDRNLTLHTTKLGSCRRVIEQLQQGKDENIKAHIRSHNSTIALGRILRNTKMFVLLADRWEIDKTKRDMEVFDKESEQLGKYFESSAPFGSIIGLNIINTQINRVLYDKLVNRIYQYTESRVSQQFHFRSATRATHTYSQTTSIDKSINPEIDYNQLQMDHYGYYFLTLIIAIFPVCSITLLCETLVFKMIQLKR